MIGSGTTFLVQLEVLETPLHAAAHVLLRQEILGPGRTLVLAKQVLSEFIHFVTDPRRFQRPLPMEDAVERARFWWRAKEVRQVFPTSESRELARTWLVQHRLRRKRILDTQLASLSWTQGVRTVITLNPGYYSPFGLSAYGPRSRGSPDRHQTDCFRRRLA